MNCSGKFLSIALLAWCCLSRAWAGDLNAVSSEAKRDCDKPCTVSCVDAHPCGSESAKVICILQKLVTAYSHGDLKAYEDYLDDHCTMFNDGTKKLIAGKADVLKELQSSFAEHAPGGIKPLKSLVIDQPYAKMTDANTCVVTFEATKEVGGAHPSRERANITDVFVKRGDEWKKLHWRGHWELISGARE